MLKLGECFIYHRFTTDAPFTKNAWLMDAWMAWAEESWELRAQLNLHIIRVDRDINWGAVISLMASLPLLPARAAGLGERACLTISARNAISLMHEARKSP